MPAALLTHTNACGWRLDGREIHCGDPVELRLRADVWVVVTFELEGDTPVFYLVLGHAWERRYEATDARAIAATHHLGARWVVYDRKRERPVFRDARDVDGELLYPDLDVDRWDTRTGAEVAAARLNLATPCPRARLTLDDGAELRWPRRTA
jgi:hypothetical protein